MSPDSRKCLLHVLHDLLEIQFDHESLQEMLNWLSLIGQNQLTGSTSISLNHIDPQELDCFLSLSWPQIQILVIWFNASCAYYKGKLSDAISHLCYLERHLSSPDISLSLLPQIPFISLVRELHLVYAQFNQSRMKGSIANIRLLLPQLSSILNRSEKLKLSLDLFILQLEICYMYIMIDLYIDPQKKLKAKNFYKTSQFRSSQNYNHTLDLKIDQITFSSAMDSSIVQPIVLIALSKSIIFNKMMYINSIENKKMKYKQDHSYDQVTIHDQDFKINQSSATLSDSSFSKIDDPYEKETKKMHPTLESQFNQRDKSQPEMKPSDHVFPKKKNSSHSRILNHLLKFQNNHEFDGYCPSLGLSATMLDTMEILLIASQYQICHKEHLKPSGSMGMHNICHKQFINPCFGHFMSTFEKSDIQLNPSVKCNESNLLSSRQSDFSVLSGSSHWHPLSWSLDAYFHLQWKIIQIVVLCWSNHNISTMLQLLLPRLERLSHFFQESVYSKNAPSPPSNSLELQSSPYIGLYSFFDLSQFEIQLTYCKAKSLFLQKDYQACRQMCETFFQSALSLTHSRTFVSNFNALLYLYGQSLIVMKQWELARVVLERLLKEKRYRTTRILNYLGIIEIQLGCPWLALERFNEAIRVDQTFLEAVYNVARIYHMQKQYDAEYNILSATLNLSLLKRDVDSIDHHDQDEFTSSSMISCLSTTYMKSKDIIIWKMANSLIACGNYIQALKVLFGLREKLSTFDHDQKIIQGGLKPLNSQPSDSEISLVSVDRLIITIQIYTQQFDLVVNTCQVYLTKKNPYDVVVMTLLAETFFHQRLPSKALQILTHALELVQAANLAHADFLHQEYDTHYLSCFNEETQKIGLDRLTHPAQRKRNLSPDSHLDYPIQSSPAKRMKMSQGGTVPLVWKSFVFRGEQVTCDTSSKLLFNSQQRSELEHDILCHISLAYQCLQDYERALEMLQRSRAITDGWPWQELELHMDHYQHIGQVDDSIGLNMASKSNQFESDDESPQDLHRKQKPSSRSNSTKSCFFTTKTCNDSDLSGAIIDPLNHHLPAKQYERLFNRRLQSIYNLTLLQIKLGGIHSACFNWLEFRFQLKNKKTSSTEVYKQLQKNHVEPQLARIGTSNQKLKSHILTDGLIPSWQLFQLDYYMLMVSRWILDDEENTIHKPLEDEMNSITDNNRLNKEAIS